MPKFLLVIVLTTSIVAFASGYLLFRSDLHGLKGTILEQEKEIHSTRQNLEARVQRVESLLAEVQKVTDSHRKIAADLKAAKVVIANLGQVEIDLEFSETLILDQKEAVVRSELEAAAMIKELTALRDSHDEFGAVAKAHTEALNFNLGTDPILADASLLAVRGIRAGNEQNYSNAVIFFDEAVEVYSQASSRMMELVSQILLLVKIVPDEDRHIFDKSVNYMTAYAKASEARVAEYKAAANLYQVIVEWVPASDLDKEIQIQNWEGLVNDATEQIGKSMDLIDDATESAPDLWQEFEVQRIEVRSWQDLSDLINVSILLENS